MKWVIKRVPVGVDWMGRPIEAVLCLSADPLVSERAAEAIRSILAGEAAEQWRTRTQSDE